MAKGSNVKFAKRQAVIARIKEISGNIEIVSGLWNEQTLDALILAFGIGKVSLNEWEE